MAKRALCIGINDYPGTGSDLSGCVNDAKDWAAVLGARGFSTSMLLDKSATKDAMTSGMRELVSSAKNGDTVVVSYSGHGTYVPDVSGDEPDQRDECLCPWNLTSAGPLVDDELHDIFSDRDRGVRVVFISDSCHSGTVARMAPNGLVGSDAPRIRFLPPSVFLKGADLARAESIARSGRFTSRPRSSALLLSGCRDPEYSYDATFQGRPNGAFTFAALQTLKTLPANANYRDWYRATRELLPSSNYPQTPNLYGTTSQKKWAVL